MSDEIRLSDSIDAEFDPLVVIVADDPDRYASFAALFRKNSFKCDVYKELPPHLVENPPPGAIYFVSFNLASHDAAQLARRIESRNNLCIVFAEIQGVETAAKLSSAKLTQTLQHPYTEKNFLMAVQTIVKKRRVQHEKDLRKQSVLDRRKGLTDGSSQVDIENADRIFKSEGAKAADGSPLIFEERILGKKLSAVIEGRGYVSGHSHFKHDRRRRGLRAIQEGLLGATYMVATSAGKQSNFRVMTNAAAPSRGHVSVSEGRAVANGRVIQSQPSGPELRAVQGSGATKSHFAIESKEKLESGHRAESEEASASKTKREGEVLVGYGKKDLRTLHDPLVNGASGSESDDPNVKSPAQAPAPLEETTKLAGGIVVPTWALIAAASIGILFCLWFLFQLLFHRH